MIPEFIVNLTVTFIIILEIINETYTPENRKWYFSKKAIRVFVIILAIISFGANISLSSKQRSYSQSLQTKLDSSNSNVRLLLSKVDSLQNRMKILDKQLMRFGQGVPSLTPSEENKMKSKKKGNVAGYIKDAKGEIVPFIKITRILNNSQTLSHKDGDFILIAVYEGEQIKFQKDGYKDLQLEIKETDFNKIVELLIQEE